MGDTVERPAQGTWQKCDESFVESFLDRARQGIHCRVGCGGRECKHEDYKKHLDKTNVHPAIDGLNANFVGDVVVASQRPSSSLFLKHMLVEQFKDKRVTGVFNLQEKGEHASCGPDFIYPETGYSYNGELDLMRFGIAYYEFPWPDMTAPENDVVLRSVQCMDAHMRDGKGRVLVHCHAGLGRTGLMIACYFILANRMSADDAIRLVRVCRPGAIQTKRQVAFCYGFEAYVLRLLHSFKLSPTDDLLDFPGFLKRQYLFLHGDEARTFRYVPRPLYMMLRRIMELTERGGPRARAVALSSFSPAVLPDPDTSFRCRKLMNHGRFDAELISDVPLLCHLVLEWFRSLDEPFLSQANVRQLLDAVRAPATSKQTVAAAVDELPRPVRHTAGVVFSALTRLGRDLPAAHLDRALQYCAEAMTLSGTTAFDEPRTFLSPVDRQLLHSAMCRWCANVHDTYFNAAAVPADRRVVAMIARYAVRAVPGIDSSVTDAATAEGSAAETVSQQSPQPSGQTTARQDTLAEL